jgi:FkbM family methyltransferase
MLNFLNLKDPISICDIGAKTGDGNDADNTIFIEDLINNSNSILYGFEPNEDEFKKLNIKPNKKYFNYGVGNGNDEILNIYKEPGLSSILEPNLDYLDLFGNFKEWFEILKKIKIKTKKLDEINFNTIIDFIKIDTQGYESEIIKFGKNTIKNSLIINVETSPIAIYKNEKNFSYICNQLEELGFSLHAFHRIDTRCFKPMILDHHNNLTGINHLFQLDCIFIKKFEIIEKLNVVQLKKLAFILFFSFKSYDLVDLLIQKISKIESIDYLPQYRDLMTTIRIKKNY